MISLYCSKELCISFYQNWNAVTDFKSLQCHLVGNFLDVEMFYFEKCDTPIFFQPHCKTTAAISGANLLLTVCIKQCVIDLFLESDEGFESDGQNTTCY